MGKKNRVPVYLVKHPVNKLLSLVIHPGRVYSVATKRPQAEDSLGTRWARPPLPVEGSLEGPASRVGSLGQAQSLPQDPFSETQTAKVPSQEWAKLQACQDNHSSTQRIHSLEVKPTYLQRNLVTLRKLMEEMTAMVQEKAEIAHPPLQNLIWKMSQLPRAHLSRSLIEMSRSLRLPHLRRKRGAVVAGRSKY